MILFINACVRSDSRTRRLAETLLTRLDGEVTEVKLAELEFPAVDESFLRKRDSLIAARSYDDPLFAHAVQFASADTIVIAAPFWDLSFPAALKQYLEQINVLGVTFEYTPEGAPHGLCRAGSLFYVTTAGGTYVPESFGFGYVEALARSFYGIPEVKMFSASGLDIYGASPDSLVSRAADEIMSSDI